MRAVARTPQTDDPDQDERGAAWQEDKKREAQNMKTRKDFQDFEGVL